MVGQRNGWSGSGNLIAGESNNANGSYNVVGGIFSSANGDDGSVFGFNSRITAGQYGVAIGHTATVSADRGEAIGTKQSATSANQSTIGSPNHHWAKFSGANKLVAASEQAEYYAYGSFGYDYVRFTGVDPAKCAITVTAQSVGANYGNIPTGYYPYGNYILAYAKDSANNSPPAAWTSRLTVRGDVRAGELTQARPLQCTEAGHQARFRAEVVGIGTMAQRLPGRLLGLAGARAWPGPCCLGAVVAGPAPAPSAAVSPRAVAGEPSASACLTTAYRDSRESEYRSRVIHPSASAGVVIPGSDSTIRCSASRAHASMRPIGRLSDLPHRDSAGARTPSGREVGTLGRRAYAPDATSPATSRLR